MGESDTIRTPRQWRVRNKLNAIIKLPEHMQECTGCEYLPIRGEITANESLLQLLGDMVEILGDNELELEEIACGQQPERSGASSGRILSEVYAGTADFLTSWQETYGTKFLNTAVLLELATKMAFGPVADHSLTAHAKIIAMSQILKKIALDPPPGWAIKTRRRSNRTEYSLHTFALPLNE